MTLVARCRPIAIDAVAAVGAVGGSIEDWEEEAGLYEIGAAAERVAAAAEAARVRSSSARIRAISASMPARLAL